MNTKKALKTLKEMKNWRNLSCCLGYEDSKKKVSIVNQLKLLLNIIIVQMKFMIKN